MSPSNSSAQVRLTLAIFGLVLVGTPLVAFLWHSLNELLQGQVYPGRLLWAGLDALLLIALLRLTWGVIGRWQADHDSGEER